MEKEKAQRISPEEVLNKKFSGVPNGYDALEVDEFLDKLISDIEFYRDRIATLEKDCAETNKLLELKKKSYNDLEIRMVLLEKKCDELSIGTNINQDNKALIKRINDLEKFLYQNGFNPSKIK